MFKNRYIFELSISEKDEKIYLYIYDINNNLFKYASKKEIDRNNHYRYYNFIYYKLLSRNKIIYLLKRNYIKIKIMAKIIENDINILSTQNQKVQFQLDKNKIEYLYEKILE